MTVVIPIEVKVRELQNRIYLAKNILSKTNHDVILGSQKDIQWKLSFFNCIYLDKGSGTLLINFLRTIKKKRNYMKILTPQSYTNWNKSNCSANALSIRRLYNYHRTVLLIVVRS